MDFSYNNSYYERRCRSSIKWLEARESKLVGPYIIQEAIEKVKMIEDHLITAQSKHKLYSN